uniref:Uncharacterized protein n=1 Tax=Astyanax mexicanus TaxID=7994 RepID=A0A3B1JTQ1_ASTMX
HAILHHFRAVSLTCLATGFYPKDVELCLRKSAEINGDDPADYDCYVNHITLEKPVITKWDRNLDFYKNQRIIK